MGINKTEKSDTKESRSDKINAIELIQAKADDVYHEVQGNLEGLGGLLNVKEIPSNEIDVIELFQAEADEVFHEVQENFDNLDKLLEYKENLNNFFMFMSGILDGNNE